VANLHDPSLSSCLAPGCSSSFQNEQLIDVRNTWPDQVAALRVLVHATSKGDPWISSQISSGDHFAVKRCFKNRYPPASMVRVGGKGGRRTEARILGIFESKSSCLTHTAFCRDPCGHERHSEDGWGAGPFTAAAATPAGLFFQFPTQHHTRTLSMGRPMMVESHLQ